MLPNQIECDAKVQALEGLAMSTKLSHSHEEFERKQEMDHHRQ